MHFGLAAIIPFAVAGCTYGPVEEDAEVTQVIRLGDSHRAVAVVRHHVFRRPTGLSTFPNGGRLRFLERRTSQHMIDVAAGRSAQLASQEAPDSLWEGFAAHVAAVEGDSVVYVRLTGCPRGGQCHPALAKEELFRLDASGNVGPMGRLPDGAALPGVMLARAPGEQHYVRFSTSGDTITVRSADAGPYRAMFVVRSDGSLRVLGGSSDGLR